MVINGNYLDLQCLDAKKYMPKHNGLRNFSGFPWRFTVGRIRKKNTRKTHPSNKGQHMTQPEQCNMKREILPNLSWICIVTFFDPSQNSNSTAPETPEPENPKKKNTLFQGCAIVAVKLPLIIKLKEAAAQTFWVPQCRGSSAAQLC